MFLIYIIIFVMKCHQIWNNLVKEKNIKQKQNMLSLESDNLHEILLMLKTCQFIKYCTCELIIRDIINWSLAVKYKKTVKCKKLHNNFWY